LLLEDILKFLYWLSRGPRPSGPIWLRPYAWIFCFSLFVTQDRHCSQCKRWSMLTRMVTRCARFRL